MDELFNNWLMAVIVIPILVGFFKNEIGNALTAWNIYRLRSFDSDGNPATSDCVQILNDATGVWVDAIIEKYLFSLNSKTRGVYLRYPDGGREKVSFHTWAGFRKRMPPPKKHADMSD